MFSYLFKFFCNYIRIKYYGKLSKQLIFNNSALFDTEQSLSMAAEEMKDKEQTSSRLERNKDRHGDTDKPFMGSCKQKQTIIEITDSALETSWRKLFSVFVEHLPDLKNANGMQTIPYLQVCHSIQLLSLLLGNISATLF